jgi:hypothetical protein
MQGQRARRALRIRFAPAVPLLRPAQRMGQARLDPILYQTVLATQDTSKLRMGHAMNVWLVHGAATIL